MNKFFITVGVLCLVVGISWSSLKNIHLGRLPGDIIIVRENYRLFVPLTTSILVSILVSLIVWFFRK